MMPMMSGGNEESAEGIVSADENQRHIADQGLRLQRLASLARARLTDVIRAGNDRAKADFSFATFLLAEQKKSRSKTIFKMKPILLLGLSLLSLQAQAQHFTHQDSLRGGNGPGRSWWDVQHYDLSVSFDFDRKSIEGTNVLRFAVTAPPHDSLQIDLQELMFLDKATMSGKELEIVKEGNIFWLKYPFSQLAVGTEERIVLKYHGKPRKAVRPPWDGGFTWTEDSNGKPWVAVSCQGLGASCWWPCKDDQGDEPDKGMSMSFHAPEGLTVVSNGRLWKEGEQDTVAEKDPASGMIRQHIYSYTPGTWVLKNPINTYNVTFYIGDYVHWSDTLTGEKGTLDLDFYALRENEAKARRQFAVTQQMLHCFEHWFGPYPFYEDGYKLVEAPYLGMEHQGAVAYGNKYKMGYLGMDRSGTGVGMTFDYIIIHESGHEWFGNNITAKDQADNWIHESFTTYSETLFAECLLGKEKARSYNIGERGNIDNDVPMIGPYGVNQEGSGDIYDKGASLLHMIRTLMNDDEKFRQMLRGLNKEFYHRTVTTQQVESYISRFAGQDFSALFDQYLRMANIPVLEWYRSGKKLYYRFSRVVPGFSLPIKVGSGSKERTIHPKAEWQDISWKDKGGINFGDDFLISPKSVKR